MASPADSSKWLPGAATPSNDPSPVNEPTADAPSATDRESATTPGADADTWLPQGVEVAPIAAPAARQADSFADTPEVVESTETADLFTDPTEGSPKPAPLPPAPERPDGPEPGSATVTRRYQLPGGPAGAAAIVVLGVILGRVTAGRRR